MDTVLSQLSRGLRDGVRGRLIAADRLLTRPWLPGAGLFHAGFSDRAFGRHSRPAFVIGSILHGVSGYQYRERRHVLPADTLPLVNPKEPYTGHTESEQLTYRVLYVEGMYLLGLFGRKQSPCGSSELNPADDGSVAVGLTRLTKNFQRNDVLGLENRLLALLEQVSVHRGDLRPAIMASHDGGTTTRLRDYLEVYTTEAFGLDQLV